MTDSAERGPPPRPSDSATALLADLERWTALDTSTTAAELCATLLGRLREAQRAAPEAGLVHQLAARALEVAQSGVARGDRPADLRGHLARSCAAEAAGLAAARSALARQAASLIGEPEPWIATLAWSAAVRDAYLAARAAARRPRALVAEGRPGLEGRVLAAELAAAGIPVWLVVDGALALLLSQARLAWIGPEAVTELGVLARIGSYAVALAAREHSVPMYALAPRRAFLPAGSGALRITEQPPDAVWDAPPAGVRPRSVHHELVPLALLRGVVVEDEVIGATEAATIARERPLPAALAGA